MKGLYRKFIFWLLQNDFYHYLLINVVPHIRWSNKYSDIDGKSYNKGYGLLKPCDIVLTYSNRQLSTVLIPGEFSHAELCVAKGVDFEMAGMTRKGYTKHTFFDVCKTADRAIIIRCGAWKGRYLNKVIRWCQEWEGAKYDGEFKLGNKALYCFELIYESDKAHMAKFKLDDLAGLGRPYLSANGILNAPEIFVIWDSHGKLAKAV